MKRSEMLELAATSEVAEYLHTMSARLAQMRYLGTGPKFVKIGARVLYRWADVNSYLDANSMTRTDGI